MATAPRLEPDAVVVEDYLAAMRAADRRTGRSTTRAARSCQAKIRRAGGWGRLNRAEQLDAVVKAPSFASWLMVTGRITVDAELLSDTDLRLGNAARLYCADDHRWFREICAWLEISGADTTVQWNTLEGLVPGAVVLLRSPQGNFEAVVGTTRLGVQTPPDANTHFRIASNTKTMTSALIVLLAQDGKLQFSEPVSTYVPDVPNGKNITIAELLKMRSGLSDYTNAPELAAALDADPTKVWTPQEVLAIAFQHPPEFPPDASYDYSNTNYALLGLLAEKAGGRPLAQQFQDRLFGPLGLQQTSLPPADDNSIPDPYSHGYMYGGTFYALVDKQYLAAARTGTLEPVDYTNQNPSYATAAGGAISTADNLATWIRALVSGKVLNATYQQQWLQSLQPEDPNTPDGQQYGYGISYQRFGPNASMYYHGGELPGFNSFMGYDADNDMALVIWTNLTLSPDGKTTANALLPTVLDEIYAGLSLASTPAPTTTR